MYQIVLAALRLLTEVIKLLNAILDRMKERSDSTANSAGKLEAKHFQQK